MFKKFAVIMTMCFALACGGVPVDQSPTDTSNTPSTTATPFMAKGCVVINNFNMKQNSEFTSYNVVLDATTAFPNVSLKLNEGTYYDPLDTNPLPLPTTESFTITGLIKGTAIYWDDLSFHGKTITLPATSIHDLMELNFKGIDNYGALLLLKTTDNFTGSYVVYRVDQSTGNRNGFMFFSSKNLYVVEFDASGFANFMSGSWQPTTANSTISLTAIDSMNTSTITGTVKFDALSGYYIDGVLSINNTTYSVQWYYTYNQ